MSKVLQDRPVRKEKLPASVQALLASEIDGMVVFDTDFNVQQINQAALHILGYSATEVKVLGLNGIFQSAFLHKINPEILALFQTGKQCLFREIEFISGSGAAKCCSAGCYPLISAAGQITGGYALLRECTSVSASNLLPENFTGNSKPNLFASLLDASLLGICGLKAIRDTKNRIVDFEWVVTNRKAAELLGIPAEKLFGAELLHYCPQHRRNGVFEAYCKTVETGKSSTIEISLHQKGQLKWYSITASKMDDGVLAMTKDITKEKAAELQMRKNELLLSDLQKIAGLGFWELNYKDERLYMSPEMYSLLGYENEQPINTYEDFLNIIPESDRLDLDQQMQYTTISRTPTTCEHQILCQHGQSKRFITRCQVLTDSAGKPLKLVGVSMDTSEVMQIKGELESIKHIEKLSQAIPFMVWTANAAGSPNYVNKEWERYTGCSAANLPVCLWYEFLHDDDKAVYLEKWFGSVGSGQDFEIEFRLRNKAGEYKWHHARAIPYISETGEIQKWYGVVCNIDDQKNALQVLQNMHSLQQEHDQQLNRNKNKLRKANAELDSLVYKVTNDLKKPVITLQKLLPELVSSLSEANHEATELIAGVQESLSSFRTTLSDISEASILDATLTDQYDQVQLDELIEELKEDMEGVIAHYRASVSYSLEVPQLQFSRKSMRSILFNLVSNAFKYATTDRLPEIQIRTSTTPDNQILIIVQDNGQTQASLFQHNITQTVKQPGVVTGQHDTELYLVRRLVENAGGLLEVESISGMGTTVSIFLHQKLIT